MFCIAFSFSSWYDRILFCFWSFPAPSARPWAGRLFLRRGKRDTMTTSQFCIIATIVVYLVAMVLVGVYCSRKGGGSSIPRVLPGRPQTGSHRHRHERRGLGHEQLAAHGSARPGLPVRRGRGRAGPPSAWPSAPTSTGSSWPSACAGTRPRSGAITIPGFFSQRFRDRRSVLSVHCRGGDPDLLHPLHRLRLQGHRHPVQQPVRRGLPWWP